MFEELFASKFDLGVVSAAAPATSGFALLIGINHNSLKGFGSLLSGFDVYQSVRKGISIDDLLKPLRVDGVPSLLKPVVTLLVAEMEMERSLRHSRVDNPINRRLRSLQIIEVHNKLINRFS